MFKKPEDWNELVDKACSVDVFKAIVQAMFDDNIVTDARLMVLEVFTMDVCERYPNIAKEIRSLYIEIYDQLIDSDNRHMFPGFVQGLCQCIANVLTACSSCI